MSVSTILRNPYVFLCMSLLFLFATAPVATPAQSPAGRSYYARVNTLGVFGAYSWDSSHMLLGAAENRKLLNIGVVYNRRLFLNRIVNWQYDGEFMPVALESDPWGKLTIAQTSPTAQTYVATQQDPPITCSPTVEQLSYSDPASGTTYSYTNTIACSGRRWTIGEAMSPVGLRWNFLPGRKTQPFVDGHGGSMYSTRPIPNEEAGSFNFTFDFGAGVELYQSRFRSIRAEYRYHHLSNHNTADSNPGIDSGLLEVTYCFRLGRR